MQNLSELDIILHQVRCGHIEVSTREQSSLVLAVEKTLTDRLEEVGSSSDDLLGCENIFSLLRSTSLSRRTTQAILASFEAYVSHLFT